MAAGTAIKVYAVYKSPPSRNQVTTVPKRRPANPHSFNWLRSPRRQREAKKPRTVTRRKKKMKTTKATQLIIANFSLSPGVDLQKTKWNAATLRDRCAGVLRQLDQALST